MTNNPDIGKEPDDNKSSLPPTALAIAAEGLASVITAVVLPVAKAVSKVGVALQKTSNALHDPVTIVAAEHDAELKNVTNAIENAATEEEKINQEVINRENLLVNNLLKKGEFDATLQTQAADQVAKAIEGQQTIPKTVGGSSIKHIQRGGQQSLKRTAKSINEFLNSSVTASHIINMVKKGGRTKRRLNRHAKKYKTRRRQI
jgi:hypothetical protein